MLGKGNLTPGAPLLTPVERTSIVSLRSRARTRLHATLALAVGTALALTACSGGSDATADAEDAPGAADTASNDDATTGEWPRTIEHAAGETEIPAQPTTIVSTSITLTGTLLAIGAPVVASAATSPGPLTDDNGFFSQWADVATEQGVEVLYPNLELDLEAVDALAPDLIIGSTIGQDATVEAYDQLSEIAPTVLLDYGSSSWEDLAAILGEATGLEDQAATAVQEFDDYVAAAAQQIALPDQPVTALTYNGAEGGRMFTESSAQATILTRLGFEYQSGPEDIAAQTRSDVSSYTAENLPTALAGAQVAFLVAAGQDNAEAMLADPLLANTAAVSSGAVVPLGPTSFRIDYYSGMQLVDAVVAEFGQ